MLFENMLNNDFSAETSLIPLASDGSILNGAHRTSIALHQHKTLLQLKLI